MIKKEISYYVTLTGAQWLQLALTCGDWRAGAPGEPDAIKQRRELSLHLFKVLAAEIYETGGPDAKTDALTFLAPLSIRIHLGEARYELIKYRIHAMSETNLQAALIEEAAR